MRSICLSIKYDVHRGPYVRILLKHIENAGIPSNFVSKLTDADGEASETGIWLDFAKDFGYINKEEYINLINRYLKAGRMLGGMMKNPEKFIPR